MGVEVCPSLSLIPPPTLRPPNSPFPLLPSSLSLFLRHIEIPELQNPLTDTLYLSPKDKHRSSTSHYRRSPRPNFLTRAYKQLKRLLRDLVYYAKRHPLKVFTLVVLPLITGGFLTALLARFGLRLPPSLERMLGLGARAMGGGGGLGSIGLMGEAVRMASGMGGGHADVRVERGRDGGMQWERKSWEREGEGILGGGWGGGMMKSVSRFFD